MNVKQIARLAGSASGAVSAAKSFKRARHGGDKLRMLDAVLTVASIAITVVIVVREIQEERQARTRELDREEER